MLQLARCYLHLSLLVSLAVAAENCVTYGDCAGLPCAAGNTPPQQLGEEGERILAELCPHLKASDGFCCDHEQTQIFKSKVGKADRLLEGCKTAVTNFRSLVCEMSCSPNQAQFLEVKETRGPQATKLRYHLSEAYSDKVWMSTRKKNKLLCGNIFSECSKNDLFSFIGNNRWTALKTEYVISETPEAGFKHASDEHMYCVERSNGVCQC